MPEVVRFTFANQPAAPAVSFTGRPWAVVYDGNCKVCGRLARVIQHWDRDGLIDVVPSQAAGVAERFTWIPPAAYRESLQLVGPGNETLQGAVAVERILDLLPKGRAISWIFLIPFARPIADRFYRWFARNRYRLGCGEHCAYRPRSSS